MTILVTGAAGFIGYHVCTHLLRRGERVVGIDNLNSYYDVRLKQARLAALTAQPHFVFHRLDIADRKTGPWLLEQSGEKIEGIIHLAAQAGVRYSLQNPHAYADSNLVGHITMLEVAKALPKLKHFVYASSSSVYGANQKLPFSVQDPVEKPISLYAATKRACELMSYSYSHVYELPITGLRFFTVYGPWGRPDMSAFLFTQALLRDEEIPLYNQGDMQRNFTYIDDVVQGTIACFDNPPPKQTGSLLHRIYNIGNNRAEQLWDFIKTLEKITGKTAKIRLEPLQPGDVKATLADITDTTRDFGFVPKTNIEEGLHHFVSWYRDFYGV